MTVLFIRSLMLVRLTIIQKDISKLRLGVCLVDQRTIFILVGLVKTNNCVGEPNQMLNV